MVWLDKQKDNSYHNTPKPIRSTYLHSGGD